MEQMTSLTLLVLAAGMGSRYGGLKQIDAIGPDGATIIDYSIYDALRAGFTKIVFVIRKDIEDAFKATVGKRFEGRTAVQYAFQELDVIPSGFSVPAGRTKPWGTTQAVLAAAPFIDGPFAVINADDFYGAESYQLLAQHLQTTITENAMVGFVLRNTLSEFGAVARGVCEIGEDNLLLQVTELTHIERDGELAVNTDPSGLKTKLDGDELVSMNMWGFTAGIFANLSEYFDRFLIASSATLTAECYLPSAVNELIRYSDTRVKVLRSHDSWFGVTYR